MSSIQWHKPKWLPRLLAMPTPEPAEQAARILAIQRNIILPAKIMVMVVTLYYLYFSHWQDVASNPVEIVLQTLQGYFIFYVAFNGVAAMLLLLRRFPQPLVQWVVFTVGLTDGLLLAGLTLLDKGFGSDLFWVFPGLIVINALSIPLATPQIVLNLTLSAFYLAAGLLYINIETESASGTMYLVRGLPRSHKLDFTSKDIQPSPYRDLLVNRLKKPAETDQVSKFVSSRLSPQTRNLLSNYTESAKTELPGSLADDLNKIVKGGSIFDSNRFAGVTLSPATSNALSQPLSGTNLLWLNRNLLLDAYPSELRKNRNFLKDLSASDELQAAEAQPEPFFPQLIILWLMTASCYGVQLLSFRHQIAEEEERKSAARNDELKAAGRLAAEIAHRLKNPLGIINNAVFTLQRGLRGAPNDFQPQMEIIREEIERSDRILTQLMGYAQLSEGRVEKLELAEELDRAIAEVFPAGTVYETVVERQYEAALPGLLVQRAHLSVVLVNLLHNARDALNGRGHISVRARRRGSHSVEIVIDDNGPGIPPDKLDKIFEPYFTSKDKGTGLGLAIVKHNVELYGGAVGVESELGKGARFVISFPAKTFIEAAA
jgi:signal transduction histidine kinase